MSISTTKNRKLLVFLSHANEDKPTVRMLCKRLKKDGFEPWLDEEQLLPGQNWEIEIEKAFKSSDAILLCFSKLSIEKEGFIQKEFKRAMYYQETKPEGMIFVIPVRLDDSELPISLRELQWVDFPSNYHRLKLALNTRAGKSHPTSDFLQKEKIASPDSPKSFSNVQLIIDRELKEFNKDKEAELVQVLAKSLNINSDDIRILRVSQGSVIILLEMPFDAARAIVEMFNNNNPSLRNLRIRDIKLDSSGYSLESTDRSVLSSKKKLLVIDDHIMFREGLVSLFQYTSDFQVVDQAGSVKEGVEKALQHRPDIILMDFSLPDGTGLDATKAILHELPDCKIVFLTVYETDENMLTAISLGAQGYMLKNVSSTSLLASLRALDNGEMAMSRKMMKEVRELSPFSQPPKIGFVSKLSPREIDILFELQNDASNLEIAQKLYLSENTVKHHIHNILDKLGVNNRRDAITIAKQMGVINEDSD